MTSETALTVAIAHEPYRVQLPVFEGPLDLLLHLIEREKLDISSVSIAQITDQFIDYVKALELVRADTLADFLVMAARLVLIKSRLLLPQPAGSCGDEEEDPGEALAQQLREYKRFKEVAEALRTVEECGFRNFVRVASTPALERHLATDEFTLADLVRAAIAAFAPVDAPPPPVGVVKPFTVTIHDQIQLIRSSLTTGASLRFTSLLQNAETRQDVVVTLLAVLELVKRKQVTVEQRGLFGEILIRPATEVDPVDGLPADL